MPDVAVMGVGMTRFGKFPGKSTKDLVQEAVGDVLNDAGVASDKIEA